MIEAFRRLKTDNAHDPEPNVSGNVGREIMPIFDLENVKGLKILDIGGGESDLTAMLLSLGADAYTIDPLYGNLDDLRCKRLQHLLKIQNISTPSNTNLDPLMWDPNLDTKRFLRSFRNNPDRYIKAHAMFLPFEDESFDRVVSFYTIFGQVDQNRDLLQIALKEATRVLKPKGKMQLAPFMIGSGLSITEKKNQGLLLNSLKKDKYLKFDILLSPFQDSHVGVLNISKK